MDDQVTFIHAADLHLDSPFIGLSRSPEKVLKSAQESTFNAFDHLVDVAIERSVDFVLLVGDLFDANVQSLKPYIKLRQACEKLEEHEIAVYLSYGNHDYMKGHVHKITFPNNVYVFSQETVTAFDFIKNSETKATIYGFSYENKAISVNKAKEFKRNNDKAPFHIGMLHGSLYEDSNHPTYAPFTLDDLLQVSFDYWALGHIHKRQILREENPAIIYSGNTQGRHSLETGPKGCYYVTLTKTTTKTEFIPLQAIQFEQFSIDLASCTEPLQVEEKIRKQIMNTFKPSIPLLIHLTLFGNDRLLYWDQHEYLAEIVEIINEQLLLEQHWMYIYQVSTNVPEVKETSKLETDKHFMNTLMKQFSETSIQPFLTDLYRHPVGRQYLQTLSAEALETIKHEAKQFLMDELLNTKR